MSNPGVLFLLFEIIGVPAATLAIAAWRPSPRTILLAVVTGALIGATVIIFHPLFGGDLQCYLAASERLVATGVPYDERLFGGSIPGKGADIYRYPPPLAIVLIPLAMLPFGAARLIWAIASCLLIALAARLAGARWPIAALAAVSGPAIGTATWGNVGAILALCTALALRRGIVGGMAVATGTWLKLAPVLLTVALLRDRRALLGLVVGTLVVLSTVIVFPAAWTSFVTLLPSILSSGGDYAENLAPAGFWATRIPALTRLLRPLTLAAAALLLLRAVVHGFRGQREAGLVHSTVAGLLVPNILWSHYLAVLLPFGARWWDRQGRVERTVLWVGFALQMFSYFSEVGEVGLVAVLAVVVIEAERQARNDPSPSR